MHEDHADARSRRRGDARARAGGDGTRAEGGGERGDAARPGAVREGYPGATPIPHPHPGPRGMPHRRRRRCLRSDRLWRGRGPPVILVDANLLVYAVNPASPEHKRARAWLDARLGGDARVGLPWESLLAFIRLTTNRRLFPRAASLGEAWRTVESWLGSDAVFVPVPTARHAEVLAPLFATRGLG